MNHLEEAAAKREEDRKHELVYWQCGKCGQEKATTVSDKVTRQKCDCGHWTKWSYRPFVAIKS